MATKDKINLPKGVDKKQLLERLKHEKAVAYKYQKRRHEAWNEIYELYRNIVRINRLTQRQSINIPLMKETVRTLGAKINEPIDANFNDRGGDIDKNIVVNELWTTAADESQMDLLDRVDKKQCLLTGRSHMVLNIDPSRDIPVTIGVEDTFDLLVDPKTKPHDIETARFVIKTNIYRPLNEILSNEKYDGQAKRALQNSYSKAGKGKRKPQWYNDQMQKKNERLEALGIDDINDLEGYDQVVALDGHFTTLWDKDKKEYVRYYVVVADEDEILRADTLENTMGVTFYPFEGWADDLEVLDYWSDSIGDLIRVPNKTINTWISQHMENRTLRSFGMNFYNSKIKGFKPQTFDPKPFGWYPLPGNPNEVYQRVDIPELQGTLQDVQFITQIAERASATGAVEKGAVEDVKRTLGEIEIAVGNALQRTNDMAPVYNQARKRLIQKWYAIMEQIVPEGTQIPLYKKSIDGKLVKRLVTKEEWASAEGYEIEVGSATQRVIEKTDEIVRMKAVAAEFPENPPLRKAIQKRMVGLVELSPQEIDEIQEYEAQRIEAIATGSQQVVPEEIEGTVDQLRQATQSLGSTPNQQL